MEMRFHFGPGYRAYYVVLGQTVYLLRGDKSSQARDIRTAKEYANYWRKVEDDEQRKDALWGGARSL